MTPITPPEDSQPPIAARRFLWPRKKGNPAEWYTLTWFVGWSRIHSFGNTPAEAIRNCYRIRRARWLTDKDPGWMTTREQYRWMRLARRIA